MSLPHTDLIFSQRSVQPLVKVWSCDNLFTVLGNMIFALFFRTTLYIQNGVKKIEKWGGGPWVLKSIMHDFINSKNFE
jgi:hypothetical protein